MSKVHQFIRDFFSEGRVKYRAGARYAPDTETTLAVAAGHAEELEDDGTPVAYPFDHGPAVAPVPPTPAAAAAEPAPEPEPEPTPPAAEPPAA